MSKARKTPRTQVKLDENERTLRELAIFVDEAVGFRLGLATYDTPQTRTTQLDRLAEAVASRPVHLTRLDLSRTPNETQLLRRLEEHLQENPAPEGKHPAVMVVGLEATLDYSTLGPRAREGLAILHNANFLRDAFPEHCPAPVVIWLNPTAATTFAQAAPDLWHWRAASFHFTGPPGERQRLERTQLAIPRTESDRLPRENKRERIALLRDLLVELENGTDCDSPGSKARRAALYLELGRMFYGLAELSRAAEHFDFALSLSREIGDRWGEGDALNSLGNAFDALVQFEKAIYYYEQALTIAREIADRRSEERTLTNLGRTYADMGQAEEAIGYYEQALVIAREIGDRRGEGYALSNLGIAYAALSQVEKAIGSYEQRLVIAHEIGDRRGEGNTLGNLGLAYAALGQVKEAIGYYEQALVIAREIGDRRGEGAALCALGIAYKNLGQVEEAIGYYEQALVIAREIGDRRGEGIALGNLGIAYAALGQVEKATDLLSQSLRIGQEIKDSRIIRFASAQLERLRGDGND
jgi:tetratricopeptide (TPR) repeat protein